MKKLVILSIIGLMSTGMFAKNANLSFKIKRAKTTKKVVIKQYWDIECTNGNSCHVLLEGGYEAAWNYAMKFCQ